MKRTTIRPSPTASPIASAFDLIFEHILNIFDSIVPKGYKAAGKNIEQMTMYPFRLYIF